MLPQERDDAKKVRRTSREWNDQATLPHRRGEKAPGHDDRDGGCSSLPSWWPRTIRGTRASPVLALELAAHADEAAVGEDGWDEFYRFAVKLWV